MLTKLLADRRTSILKRWLGLILESYSPEVARFLGSERDRFANPVGQTISREIEAVYDGLRTSAEVESFVPALDAIIRVRAVQDFAASKAVSFVFLIKRAIREELATEIARGTLAESLVALETRIDTVAGRCFDLYMGAREKIYEIRANELRRRTYFLLERATRGEGETDAEAPPPNDDDHGHG